MWICVSERWLSRCFHLSLAGLGVAALVFYQAQNQPGAPGGPVALSKVLWLAAVLACWYVIPALAALDGRAARALRLAFAALLLNMTIRAILELWMMYVGGGWHHYYGIAHDAFSAALCLGLAGAVGTRRGLDGVLRGYLWLMAPIFALEGAFAVYLHERLGGGEAEVWFVPGTPEHAPVLVVTWVAVALIALYLLFLRRTWLHEPAVR